MRVRAGQGFAGECLRLRRCSRSTLAKSHYRAKSLDKDSEYVVGSQLCVPLWCAASDRGDCDESDDAPTLVGVLSFINKLSASKKSDRDLLRDQAKRDETESERDVLRDATKIFHIEQELVLDVRDDAPNSEVRQIRVVPFTVSDELTAAGVAAAARSPG